VHPIIYKIKISRIKLIFLCQYNTQLKRVKANISFFPIGIVELIVMDNKKNYNHTQIILSLPHLLLKKTKFKNFQKKNVENFSVKDYKELI